MLECLTYCYALVLLSIDGGDLAVGGALILGLLVFIAYQYYKIYRAGRE